MNRRVWGRRRPARRLASWGALAAAVLAFAGCVNDPLQTRLQSGEESEAERYGVKTVGDVTSVGNADPIPVATVGLVVGLDGTGGDPAPDNYRAQLEEQLTKEGVKDVKRVLADPSNALVVVTALVPPGAAEGAPIDVEVALPPHPGKATSLRGGCLRPCVLCNYNYTKNLEPSYAGSNLALKGTRMMRCEGPVVVGMGDGEEADRLKRGRVWNGGRCLKVNPLLLVLNPEYQQGRVAAMAADRINEAFRGGAADAPDQAVAVAHDNLALELHVPAAYKLNLPRYLRVVRLVPMQEPGAAADGRSYPDHIARDLLDPARTVTAALRLEALGQQSLPALRAGLESPHPLVRFCAAESLAYLDCPAGGEELGRDVAKQPLLRAYALTALASLDESVSHVQLRDLLLTSADAETRYGAFRALRALDENDPLVRGDFLNDSFWLHRVAPDAAPLVHVSTARRPEIVLFGQEPALRPPFSVLAGEFVVRATADDDACLVTRFSTHGGENRKRCPLKVEDVLRTMADMGATYAEALEMLRQARRCDCLTCELKSDALPQAVTVQELDRAGKAGDLVDSDGKLIAAPQDLGATPTLYGNK